MRDELMHCRSTAKKCPLTNHAMTGEERAVRHDHVVSQHAIVGNMRLTHDETVIADRRCVPEAGRG